MNFEDILGETYDLGKFLSIPRNPTFTCSESQRLTCMGKFEPRLS